MNNLTTTQQNTRAGAPRPRAVRARRWLSLAVCAAGCVAFLVTLVTNARVAAPSPAAAKVAAANAAPAAPAGASPAQDGLDFSRFLHNSPRHSSLRCDECHRREGRSIQPQLPGHKSCTGCHLAQFVSNDNPVCTICHTSLEMARPNDKGFPGLKSFNAVFPHDRHETGAGRPAEGCASCHAPAGRGGVARSVPATLNAHNNCYECHSPGGSAGNLSSCGDCHKQGRFVPASTAARAFAVSFSHNDHGPRQRLDCAACHNVRGGAQESRLEVTAPAPTQHFGSGRGQSCMTCHDNRRAFGGEDFQDCKRCHKGPTFSFGRRG